MREPEPASLCSRNEHKLAELRRVLPGFALDLLDAAGFPPEEDESYYANARAKAIYGRSVGNADFWMLGEDSGLEVAALGGGPGVRSARFAALGDEPVEKLLRELEGTEGAGRRARYVCELVCLAPGGDELRGTGTLEGSIATESHGSEGFGYDPVFVPQGEVRTVAELGDEWKARGSHRALAARALQAALAGARATS